MSQMCASSADFMFQTRPVGEDPHRACSVLHLRPTVLRVPWNWLERN